MVEGGQIIMETGINSKQHALDVTYMRMAYELAKLSKAEKAKVGALIVKDTHIIAEGYNGTPVGFDNTCERIVTELNFDVVVGRHLETKPEVLHAESNAITKVAKSTMSSEGATLYVTLQPCFDCSKLIIQAGIKRVVYKESYEKPGVNLLLKAGIDVKQLIETPEEYYLI